MNDIDFLPPEPPYVLPRYPITVPARDHSIYDPPAALPWQTLVLLAVVLIALYLSLG